MKPHEKELSAALRTSECHSLAPRAARLLTLLLWALPIAVQAQYTCTTNYAGKITIAKYTGAGGAVTIPSTIHGVPVATIGFVRFVIAPT